MTKALAEVDRARSSPCRTGCARCPSRSGRGCPAPTSRWAPTGSASPTPGPPRAATSTPTPNRQVVAVLEALARDGEIDPSVPVAAARQYRIDDVHGRAGADVRSRPRRLARQSDPACARRAPGLAESARKAA